MNIPRMGNKYFQISQSEAKKNCSRMYGQGNNQEVNEMCTRCVKNGGMTPWERLHRELRRRRKTLVSLAQALGTSKQTVGHWRYRGIPIERMQGCADFIGRSVEWLEFGEEVPGDLFDAVKSVAVYLQSLGRYDQATVVSLFTTLAHSPRLHESVANGLAALSKDEDKSD